MLGRIICSFKGHRPHKSVGFGYEVTSCSRCGKELKRRKISEKKRGSRRSGRRSFYNSWER